MACTGIGSYRLRHQPVFPGTRSYCLPRELSDPFNEEIAMLQQTVTHSERIYCVSESLQE